MLAFGLFLLATNLVLQGIVYLVADETFVAIIVGAAVGVALPAWYVSRAVGSGLARDFDVVFPGTGRLAATAVVAVAALVPTSLLAGLSERLNPVDQEWLRQLLADLPNTTIETVLAYVAVGLAAPLAEELVFRGIVYRLARGLWGAVAAAVISALCFGLVHFEPWYFFGLVAVGLVFAFVYETTRSLFACWFAHGVHNACSLTLILTDRHDLGASSEILDLGETQALLVSLVALAIGGVYLASRRRDWD
jgi:membrane protease YdiL (CAAX protease family)